MDRQDRIAVIGTWPRHRKEPEKHDLVNEDPRGWKSHHTAHEREPGALLEPSQLVEAIRARAYEIYLHRVKLGGHADPHGDWLQAEREVLAAQARIGGGQGAHPAVPGKLSGH